MVAGSSRANLEAPGQPAIRAGVIPSHQNFAVLSPCGPGTLHYRVSVHAGIQRDRRAPGAGRTLGCGSRKGNVVDKWRGTDGVELGCGDINPIGLPVIVGVHADPGLVIQEPR